MNMIFQNLKVAFRNLMKYKVQTLLSIVSIAIGIVTLSLAFSVMTRFRLPSLYSQPHKDRSYEVWVKNTESDKYVSISYDAFKAIKQNGGPRSAERIAMLNGTTTFPEVEFHLMDSTIRKGKISGQYLDPEYIEYDGLRSAITGEKIRRLKKGEAIISENFAKELFQDANPVGAIQTLSNYTQPFPVTIVDVHEEVSFHDPFYKSRGRFLMSIEDNAEDYTPGEFDNLYISIDNMYVVLKEGSTVNQLEAEINSRIKSLGLQVELRNALNDKDMNRLIAIHILVYIIGSLLLVAAIIGFLRMQIQLFWMRRREISLRIVNGSKRIQLFWLLVTEVVITIIVSIGLSIILGYILEDFLSRNLGMFMYYQLIIRNLWIYSVATGGVLFLICGMVAWIVIQRVCNSRQGLARSMRRSRSHLFRNAMLGIQIAICIIFVSTTFILINGGRKTLEAYNVPENNEMYKEFLYLMPWESSQPQRFVEEIDSIPELDKMIMGTIGHYSFKEVEENPEAREKYRGRTFMKEYISNDTTFLSLMGIEVEWFNRDIDRNNCILIGEDYYREFKELGLLDNNTLTMNRWRYPMEVNLPVAGIIKKVPYDNDTKSFVIIYSPYNKFDEGYILIPKSGKSKVVESKVKEIYESIDPGNLATVYENYRSLRESDIDSVEAFTALGWILGIVSLIICAMSIFSTILLDTRSRRKEVAIRKVNGAKSKDIYRIFCRVYVLLLVLATILAVPVCVMFNRYAENYVNTHQLDLSFSPFWPIVIGISIVVVLIFAIVGWQTHRVLQVDPAKIISKE